MELEKFEDVHPNWSLIEQLDESQADATLKLLLTGTFLGGPLAEHQLQAMSEAWRRLPFVGPQWSDSTLDELLTRTHDELEQILAEPERFDGFMAQVAAKLGDQETQIAVVRLLAIVLTEDGLDEREQALLFAAGQHCGLHADTIDDLMRSVWESYEESQFSSPGKKRAHALHEGKHFARNRPSPATYNPFTTSVM